MKKAVLYLWQLPQHLLGLFLIKVLDASKTETAGIAWHLYTRKGPFSRFFSGGSFGEYILLPYENENTVKHERGHSVWSMYLGWLYLPVVGVYSAVFCNLWDRLFHKNWNSYDRQYWYYKTRWTEREADRAGGVDRDAALLAVKRQEGWPVTAE